MTHISKKSKLSRLSGSEGVEMDSSMKWTSILERPYDMTAPSQVPKTLLDQTPVEQPLASPHREVRWRMNCLGIRLSLELRHLIGTACDA